jgi:hypothetical protein
MKKADTLDIVEASFTCGCHTESVHLTKWKGDEEVYFSMWNMSGFDPRNLTWKHRLRHIWRIVRKGAPFLDQLVLGETDAHSMGQWLLDNTQSESRLDFTNHCKYHFADCNSPRSGMCKHE